MIELEELGSEETFEFGEGEGDFAGGLVHAYYSVVLGSEEVFGVGYHALPLELVDVEGEMRGCMYFSAE